MSQNPPPPPDPVSQRLLSVGLVLAMLGSLAAVIALDLRGQSVPPLLGAVLSTSLYAVLGSLHPRKDPR